MSAVLSWEAARKERNRLEAEGKRLVFTNGCFDLLHVGHVRYLNEARALGDALCVALNADASVEALKGPNRPINALDDRAEVLLGLSAVDFVVEFVEERATSAIEAIAPHVYAKGGDYTAESLNLEEREALDRVGASIEILSLVDGKSTTETLSRLQESSAKNLRLGVLGSGQGSSLEGIFKAIEDGRLPDTEVALVISDQPDARMLQVAKQRDVPAAAVDPGPFKTKLGEPAQKEIRDRLKAAAVDLVILAGFMRRLKAPVLEAFPKRVFNIHPSLLPNYPGLRAWEQALDAGETEAGSTVHIVDEGLDTGPILGQTTVPILKDDNAEDLLERIKVAERELYPRVISDYAATL